MIFIKVLFVLCILPNLESNIYVFNTVDSPSIEQYDCILHEGQFYCRRPDGPIVLNRSNGTIQCYNNGTAHLFSDLRRDNISLSTVLHKWKSGIEKAEHYSRYLRVTDGVDESVCNCVKNFSFGKNCEYLLPMGASFAQTWSMQSQLRRYNPRQVQMYGTIICYRTLNCNSGLLCLDWREICDGAQQCMSGIDEDDCDKLEFNECEDDEYRCMNGMCIPEEYFLDGEFDCLDWSDELQYEDDEECPIGGANIQCDDRICPPNYFSCGDGQCIPDRFEFQKLTQVKSECRSRREQYFMCEMHRARNKWTLPNGRCFEGDYTDRFIDNRTMYDECEYILRCSLSKGLEAECPCGRDELCDQLQRNTCLSIFIHYPKGGIMAPYILFYYDRIRNPSSDRPDFSWLNGTIKCGSFIYEIPNTVRFPYITTVRQVVDSLCKNALNSSVVESYRSGEHCFNRSFTFDNRPYSFSKVCDNSKQCTSTYRIRDGFANCVDKMDESDHQCVSSLSLKMRQYRFRCSENEPTCLSVASLGNLRNDCQNKFDELWLGTNTQLVNINCNKQWKDQCEILRQYIRNSWITTNTNGPTKYLEIPFRYYCDTFWNLASQVDEDIGECQKWWTCSDDQWRCDNGQCIYSEWVLDGHWDCFDASDEYQFLIRSVSDRNLQLLSSVTLQNKSSRLNRTSPFASFCNLTIEFPCLPIQFSNPLANFEIDRPCISRHLLGNGRIDCYGAIDELNTITHCNQTGMLGYNFRCNSSEQCIPYWNHCTEQQRCEYKQDDWFWCDRRENLTNFDSFFDTVCFNGTVVKNGRCNRFLDCLYGEDEYMCEYENVARVTGLIYRKEKELTARRALQKLRLLQFPNNSNATPPNADAISVTSTVMPSAFSGKDAPISYWCNRGVGVQLYDGSIACFCPPQYYGDKCEFHSDRITILFHLNLSQSIYTVKQDVQIVLKILVLFLYEDEVLTNNVFHVRPITDMFVYSKKLVHLLYSRSSKHLQYKTQRYFNQSSTSSKPPYSIRIEIYERLDFGEPMLSAVWQYPLHFNYLPVFRFAKTLRLKRPDISPNPCSSNPCNQNQDCQPLQNSPSRYICLCKSNFTGENCSEKDEICTSGYCAFSSLCKPNYRGLVNGNHLPYCVCSFDLYGDQCDIRFDRCLPNPCQNGGSCYATSKPSTVACICTDHYHGNNCELKNPEIKLDINQTMPHKAAVLQYFDIDFVQLNLILVRQQVYHILPTTLEYRHKELTAPEIILVKLYSSFIHHPPQLYLISINVNATTIHATTQLTDNNHCQHIHSFISINQTHNIDNYSPIRYHFFCQNNTDLLCFHDDHYLCICDENHARVECFRYDLKLDECQHCLSGGRCIKGDRSQANKFICLCPSCHSGAKCQFNSNSFAFTLDQLFFLDLTSNHKEATTLQLLIIMPLLMFIIALPNNICSFLTFRRPRCLRNGIGHYLLSMSIINQLNLAFLSSRLIHLAISITGLEFHSHSSIDNYLCKIFNYLLICSSRMVYWLSSLVAIERLYMTLFLNGQWLRKPHIARYLIIFIVISNLLSGIHELIFVTSVSDVHHEKDSMCVIVFPLKSQSTWLLYHRIISIINSILPLFINMCCTIIISGVVTKNKLRTHRTETVPNDNKKQLCLTNFRTRLQLTLEVLKENKELIVGPGITLVPQLFSLPLFIVSFTFYCENLENTWIRYPLIVSYFITFIPQLTSFLLYVVPSSFYTTEWRATKLHQRITTLFRSTSPDATASQALKN